MMGDYADRYGNGRNLTPEQLERSHPEDRCERCGGANVSWFTRDSLWNAHSGGASILCPVCFVAAAEADGVRTTWAVVPRDYHTEGHHPLCRVNFPRTESQIRLGRMLSCNCGLRPKS